MWANGEFAVHAGATYDDDGARFIRRQGLVLPDDLPMRAIVGVANCSEAHHAWRCEQSPDIFCSPWAMPFSYHWRLTTPRPIEPVTCRGMQGMWTVPDEIAAAVREQVQE